ncbi:zinc-ribbon domain-containing protein [bacterium]
MEQLPNQSWLHIQCPKCESRYRIDRSKIPPQGASIRCKKCDTKLILKRKQTKPAEHQPKPLLNTDTCPKCGFHQERGELCYQCGTRIRQASSTSSEQPDSEAAHDQFPTALIDINVKYRSSQFILSIAQLMIEIDGELYPRFWGKQQFQVPPGKYHIKVYGLLFGKHLGERSQIITVKKDDFVELEYMAHSQNDALFVIGKHESNAPWRSLIHRSTLSEKDPWYYKPFPIIFSLVTLFPVGLYLLWRSKHFSDSHKLIIAVVGLAAFLWIIFHIKPLP